MTPSPQPPQTKICSICKSDKPLGMYNKAEKGPNGVQDYCRECQNRKNREHYHANKDAYYSKAHDNRSAGLERRLAMVRRLLPDLCARCPSPISINQVRRLPKAGCTLHPDATPKWMAGQGWAEDRILDQMDRCIFVCPTCYRRAAKQPERDNRKPGKGK